MYNKETLPRIVYIAGSGRSGSTLLDIMLGSHPLAFGSGELARFFLDWSQGDQCTCGQSYPNCILWGKVINRLQTTFPDLTPLEAERISRRVESLFGSWQSSTSSLAADRQLYSQLWQTMMGAISQESGKKIIIDSSKSSHPVVRRILALGESEHMESKVIHLVRDPRAMMWSAFRGSNRQLVKGQQATMRGSAIKALVSWGMINASVHIIETVRPQLNLMRLRYEDLVSHPVQVLRRLGSFLNLDLEPVIELVDNQQPLDPGHGVGGNRMRQRGPIRIKPDVEWREALPGYARILASLSWPLARKYDYHVLRKLGHESF